MCLNTLGKECPKVLDTTIKGTVKGSVTETSSAKIIGSGNFKVGKIRFTAQLVPKLDANLISAGKLIIDGYSATMKKDITPGVDIEIKKNEKVVATGDITENNMMELYHQMEEETEIIRKTEITDHIKNGHQGNCECHIYIEAKRRRKNTVKGKEKNYEPLEKISIDMQGHISIQGIDGSRYNMKLVDSCSNYMTVIPTLDKSSKTTSEIYDYFIKRNERTIGKKDQIYCYRWRSRILR